jgi:hypothetical protein
VLNLKDVTVLIEIEGNGVKNEELEGLAMIKEWVPLAPGNVEHNYSCYDHGLMQVEDDAGGPTVNTSRCVVDRADFLRAKATGVVYDGATAILWRETDQCD